jgi:outer membrane immunogenic protein
MKHIIRLSALGAVLMTTTAFAADLPRRSMAPAPAQVYAVPVFTWSGLYVGLNAGGGFSANNGSGANTFFLPAGSIVGSAGTNGVLTLPSNGNNNRSGFVGGAQIGYNWQAGSFVYGLETDIQYANLSRRNGQITTPAGYTFVGVPGAAFGGAPPATVVSGFGSGSGQNYFGTVRGRLGFAFDRTLIYGTAGLAYGGNNSRVGYAAGGGVEYAFSNAWSAKLEALYVSLGRNNNNGAGGVYNGGTNILTLANNASRRNDFVVVRAGLNYRFGGTSSEPVLARY